jgi:hypothetical protein
MLMRTMIAALATLVGASTMAHAQTVWQGQAVIEGATAGCRVSDAQFQIRKGDTFRSVFRPAALEPSNGPDHRLMFVADRGMTTLRLTNAVLPAGSYTGIQFDQLARGAGVAGTYSSMTIAPATVTLATINVLVRGKITDFFAISGCQVTFRASLSRRP